MSIMSKERVAQHANVLIALGFESLVAIGLYAYGAWTNHSWQYWYFIWNLFLAWLPLVFAYTLIQYLKKHLWFSWQAVVLSVLWLGFLPNSFYMLSDFIHLGNVVRVDLDFDVIMIAAFAVAGLTLGFSSLYLIHRELIKRFAVIRAHMAIVAILLLCGFAVYLGRDLRWNTWDILVNPAGVLFDVATPIISSSNPEVFSTTLGYFALLGSIYTVVWQFVRSIAGSARI